MCGMVKGRDGIIAQPNGLVLPRPSCAQADEESSDLVLLVDQHAADERIRLERLIAEVGAAATSLGHSRSFG